MYFMKKTRFESSNLSGNFSNASYSTCDVLDISFAVQISNIVVFSIILLCGLVGNALIATIVYNRKELRKTVNFFIVNMAISDFAFLLTGIPLKLVETVSGTRQWPISDTLGLITCKLEWYIEDVSVSVSVESLVFIALDRFIAVVVPMKAQLVSSNVRAFAIASTWILAAVLNSPDLVANELVRVYGERICAYVSKTAIPTKIYNTARVAIVIAVPLILMTALYSVIALTLRRTDKTLRSSAGHHRKDQAKQRAIKMAFTIMAVFYICFLPMPLALILWEHDIALPCSVYILLYFLSNVLLFLSSSVNPIICMVFVQSYRRGLMELFRWNKTQGEVKVTSRQR